jgi:hypothetical protein
MTTERCAPQDLRAVAEAIVNVFEDRGLVAVSAAPSYLPATLELLAAPPGLTLSLDTTGAVDDAAAAIREAGR